MNTIMFKYCVLSPLSLASSFILLWFIFAPAHCAGRSKEAVVADKVKQLTDLNYRRPLIRLKGEQFRNLVKSSPKNYSVIVMLTALQPGRQCQICQQAHDEFQIVAHSWRYSPEYNNRLFFAMVDFDDGPDVFQMLKLNSAPTFMHFPAKGKPKKQDTLDLQRHGFAAEMVGRWVQERTEVSIRIFRPPNYSATVLIVLLFLVVGVMLYVRRNNLEFLYNKRGWGITAICIMLAMTSGQMWNHIRGPPFMHRNPQTGQVAYIHGSSQAQFVVETYLVMLMNGAVVVGMILLIEAGTPDEKGEKKAVQSNSNASGEATGKKRIQALIGLAVMAIFFSLVLSVFRSKYGGYPYSFLIK